MSAGKRLFSRLLVVSAGALLVTACGPSIVMVSDPLFAQTVPTQRAFADRLAEAAREYGYRGRVIWMEPTEEAPLGLPLDTRGLGADLVLLSPFYSLSLTNEFGDQRFPDTGATVVSLGVAGTSFGGVTGAVVDAAVEFDVAAAYRMAGAHAATWQSEADGRQTIVLINEASSRGAAVAFEDGFADRAEPSGGRPVSVERFRTAPTRQEIADAIARYPKTPDTLWVLLLGRADQSALTLLRAENVRLGLRGVDPALDPERVAFSVVDDPIAAAAAVLEFMERDELPSGDRPVAIAVESSLFSGSIDGWPLE